MITMPAKDTKQWLTGQNGDLFGNIIRSRNLDFNTKGYLKLARKPIMLYSTAQDSDFKLPVCILDDGSTLYVITVGHMWKIGFDSANITFSEDTGKSFGFQSDAVFYQGLVHGSGTTNVESYSGGSWTSRITGLSSSYPHPLCVSEHQQYLAVGDGNTVKLYDTGYSLNTTLTIPSDHVVVWIRWRNNTLYIGTRNINGGEAKLYLWNGAGTAAQSGWGVQCDWIFSGCEYDNGIAVIASSGRLLKFNGGGFDELADLPVYFTNFSWSSSNATFNIVGNVASRGMCAKGKRLYINLNGAVRLGYGSISDQLPNQPSGVWCYDPDVGLYHKAGYPNKQFQQQNLNGQTVSANAVSLPAAAVFETGDPVLLASFFGLTGSLNSGAVYYAIKVDSTHVKLALSAADAVAGNAIAIGGSPGTLDILSFETYRSVGATAIENAGAIYPIGRYYPDIFNGSEFVFGGDTNDNATTSQKFIASLGMGRNVGSLITPKIQASAVADVFQKIISKFPKLNLATQSIIIKYRTQERFGYPINGTTSQFSTFLSSGQQVQFAAPNVDGYIMAIGDEIEFTEGAAAGYTAHITAIDNSSAPTFKLTLDETPVDVATNDTCDFRMDNWKKWRTILSTDKDGGLGFSLDEINKGTETDEGSSKWVQFKIELRGCYDTALEELAVVNADDISYD